MSELSKSTERTLTMKTHGKNLIKSLHLGSYVSAKPYVTSLKTTASFPVTLDNSVRCIVGYPIKIKANTNYTLSCSGIDNCCLMAAVYEAVSFTDTNSKAIKVFGEFNINSPLSINYKEDCYILPAIAINYIYASSGKIVTFNSAPLLQLEEGAIVTSYESYKESSDTYTLSEPLRSLPDGTCDEFDIRTGIEIRRIGKVIFKGEDDEGWTINNSKNGLNRILTNKLSNLIKPSITNDTLNEAVSNLYKTESANNTYDNKEGLSIDTNGSICIYDKRFNILEDATLAKYKAFLAENNLVVLYKLKTPVVINHKDKIGQSALKQYSGRTYVESEETSVKPVLTTEYIKSSKTSSKDMIAPYKSFTSDVSSVAETEKNKENKYPLKITTCGKNIINPSQYNFDSPNISFNDDIVILSANNPRAYVYASTFIDELLEDGKVYCFNYIIVSSSHNSAGISIELVDRVSRKKITDINKDTSFTANLSKYSYKIKFYTNITSNSIQGAVRNEYKIQLEEGSTPTAYEKYKSSTETIYLDEPLRELPNGVKDEYDIRTGYYKRAVGCRVLNGTENWSVSSFTSPNNVVTQYTIKDTSIKVTDSRDKNIVSNHYVLSYDELNKDITHGIAVYLDNYIRVYTRKGQFETVSDFNKWLANNPITILYELAEPVITKIKDIPSQTVLKQYGESTHVFYNTEVKPEAKVEYFKSINSVDNATDIVSPTPKYMADVMSVGELNSRGKYDVKIKTTGKNLLDFKKNIITSGCTYTSNSNTITVAGNEGFSMVKWDISNIVQKGHSYSISCNYESLGVNSVKQFRITLHTIKSNKWYYFEDIATIPDEDMDYCYLEFVINNSSTLLSEDAIYKISDVQLEEGLSTTGYEKYKESFTTVELDEPLRRLPNGVHDEYDIRTGIETRRIKRINIDESSYIVFTDYTEEFGTYRFSITDTDSAHAISDDTNGIWSNIAPALFIHHNPAINRDKLCVSRHSVRNDEFSFIIPKEYGLDSIEKFRKFCIDNNVYVLTEIDTDNEDGTPKIITTKHKAKATQTDLKQYSGKTVVSNTNNIKASLTTEYYKSDEAKQSGTDIIAPCTSYTSKINTVSESEKENGKYPVTVMSKNYVYGREELKNDLLKSFKASVLKDNPDYVSYDASDAAYVLLKEFETPLSGTFLLYGYNKNTVELMSSANMVYYDINGNKIYPNFETTKIGEFAYSFGQIDNITKIEGHWFSYGTVLDISKCIFVKGRYTKEEMINFVIKESSQTYLLDEPLRRINDNIKDTIEDGVLTRRVGSITLNSNSYYSLNEENSNLNTLKNVRRYTLRLPNNSICNNNKFICDSFNSFAGSSNYYYYDGECMYVDGGIKDKLWIHLDRTAFSTIEAVKSFINENPVTIYYPLETPVVSVLTPVGELKQYENGTYIYSGNEVNPNINIEYYKTDSAEPAGTDIIAPYGKYRIDINSMGDAESDGTNYPVTIKTEGKTPIETSTDTYSFDEPLRSIPNGVSDEYDVRNGILIRRVGVETITSDNVLYAYGNWKGSNLYYINTSESNWKAAKVNKDTVGNGITDSLKWNYDFNANPNYSCRFKYNENDTFYITLEPDSTYDDVKEYLRTNPITVLYELETPIVTCSKDDPYQTQLKQFSGKTTVSIMNKIKSDIGVLYNKSEDAEPKLTDIVTKSIRSVGDNMINENGMYSVEIISSDNPEYTNKTKAMAEFNEPLRSLPNGVCDYYTLRGRVETRHIGKLIITGADDIEVMANSDNGNSVCFKVNKTIPQLTKDYPVFTSTISEARTEDLSSSDCTKYGAYICDSSIHYRIYNIKTVDIFKKILSSNPDTVFYPLDKYYMLHYQTYIDQDELKQYSGTTYVTTTNTTQPEIFTEYYKADTATPSDTDMIAPCFKYKSTIDSVGKEERCLVRNEEFTNGFFDKNNNYELTSSNDYLCIERYIPVNLRDTITFEGPYPFLIVQYDENKNPIEGNNVLGRGSDVTLVITNTNTKFVRFHINTGDLEAVLNGVHINISNESVAHKHSLIIKNESDSGEEDTIVRYLEQPLRSLGNNVFDECDISTGAEIRRVGKTNLTEFTLDDNIEQGCYIAKMILPDSIKNAGEDITVIADTAKIYSRETGLTMGISFSVYSTEEGIEFMCRIESNSFSGRKDIAQEYVNSLLPMQICYELNDYTITHNKDFALQAKLKQFEGTNTITTTNKVKANLVAEYYKKDDAENKDTDIVAPCLPYQSELSNACHNSDDTYSINIKTIGKNIWKPVNKVTGDDGYTTFTLKLTGKNKKFALSGLELNKEKDGITITGDVTGEIISTETVGRTVKFAGTTNKYVDIRISSEYDSTDNQLQLEEGIFITKYAPYEENIDTYQLSKPLRGIDDECKDTIENGEIITRIGEIKITEDIMNSAEFNIGKEVSLFKIDLSGLAEAPKENTTNIKSNSFIYDSNKGICFEGKTLVVHFDKKITGATSQEVIKWFANNNVIVQYELESYIHAPFEFNELILHDGTTHVFILEDNKPIIDTMVSTLG